MWEFWGVVDLAEAAGHAEPAADVPAGGIGTQQAGNGEKPGLFSGRDLLNVEPCVQGFATGVNNKDQRCGGEKSGQFCDKGCLLLFGKGWIVEFGNKVTAVADVVLAADRGIALVVCGTG